MCARALRTVVCSILAVAISLVCKQRVGVGLGLQLKIEL